MAALIAYAFPSLILVFLAEAWWRRYRPADYYRLGIPVMKWSGPAGQLSDARRLAQLLAAEATGLSWLSLPAGGFGLHPDQQRSDTWLVNTRKSNALTRGWLRVDSEQHTIRLTVYLNWSIFIFLPAWFGFAFAIPILIASLVFLTMGSLVIYLMLCGEREIYLGLWAGLTEG